MARITVNINDRVEIKVGDEKGSWGIVYNIRNGFYHVGIAGDITGIRIYERSEIRKSMKKEVPTASRASYDYTNEAEFINY